MAAADDVTARMIDSALALASEGRWRDVSLVDVARRAEVSLLDAYRTMPDKASLLASLIAATDRQVLAAGPADALDPPRDRLFDVLMRRFDALQERRAGITAILRELPYDPVAAISVLPRFATAIAWMLETAGLSSVGLAGNLRVKALAVIYLRTLQVWLDDDSADMARTMAALDKTLRRAERIVRNIPGLRPAVNEAPGSAYAGADLVSPPFADEGELPAAPPPASPAAPPPVPPSPSAA